MSTERFKGSEWYREEGKYNRRQVFIGGAGSIGSWLTLLLSRLGMFNILVVDDDEIEEINLAGQFYNHLDIGKSKVGALGDNVRAYSNTDINIVQERITKENIVSYTKSISFSAFDNMEARKIMFEDWVIYARTINPNYALFVDGRMAAESFQIFFVTPDRIDKYREHLFDSTEVKELPCTYKYTTHTACMIASQMVAIFTNYLSNKKQGFEYREVPFQYTFDIPLMSGEINDK